jgi:hypothetical protein
MISSLASIFRRKLQHHPKKRSAKFQKERLQRETAPIFRALRRS